METRVWAAQLVVCIVISLCVSPFPVSSTENMYVGKTQLSRKGLDQPAPSSSCCPASRVSRVSRGDLGSAHATDARGGASPLEDGLVQAVLVQIYAGSFTMCIYLRKQ